VPQIQGVQIPGLASIFHHLNQAQVVAGGRGVGIQFDGFAKPLLRLVKFPHLVEKLAVLKSVVQAIKPAGWFLNADLMEAEAPEVERRIQEIRVEAVTHRAPAKDQRFCSNDATRQFLDDLEATEQDQPLTLDKDMRILRESGIANAEVFWEEYREAAIGGTKTNVA